MRDTNTPKALGRILLVSRDAIANRQMTDAMQRLALSVEACVDISAAAERLSRNKFEAVVIDLALDQGFVCLERVRASATNRTAVIFTLTSSSHETAHALKQGSSFVLQRPLTAESIDHTLKVAYGFIVRERRRYFRYPVTVPVALRRKAAPEEVFGQTINISERGMALRTLTPLAMGSEATAQFTLPDPLLRITAESKVCWNNEKGEAGLFFHFLPSDLVSELQSWLAQKLEKQLPPLVTDKFR